MTTIFTCTLPLHTRLCIICTCPHDRVHWNIDLSNKFTHKFIIWLSKEILLCIQSWISIQTWYWNLEEMRQNKRIIKFHLAPLILFSFCNNGKVIDILNARCVWTPWQMAVPGMNKLSISPQWSNIEFLIVNGLYNAIYNAIKSALTWFSQCCLLQQLPRKPMSEFLQSLFITVHMYNEQAC